MADDTKYQCGHACHYDVNPQSYGETMSDEIEEHGIYEAYRSLFNRNAKLVAALAWMETHDPVLVEMARSKFCLQQSMEKP